MATNEVDPRPGNITALLATKPGLAGVFEFRIHILAHQLISIGRDAVIVPDRFSEEAAS